MASVDFDDAGEKMTARDPRFEEESYAKFCEDVYDRIDILSEHADCGSECLKVSLVYQKEISEPLHDMGNGLKLEVASLRGNLGPKDLTRPNVPPGLWNAIETGFDSISSLEAKRNEDLSLVGKIEKRLLDCEEASEFLISLQARMFTSLKLKKMSLRRIMEMKESSLLEKLSVVIILIKGLLQLVIKGLMMEKVN